VAIPALLAGCFAGSTIVMAGQFDARIPMSSGTTTTYYVEGRFGNLEATEFLVDTGSGFLTINSAVRDELLRSGLARYTRDQPGVLHNVEAVVFPSTSRQILGLNVLNRSAPFIFSVNPPELVLSHCTGKDVAEAEIAAPADQLRTHQPQVIQ
jgi:hypothetical protein